MAREWGIRPPNTEMRECAREGCSNQFLYDPHGPKSSRKYCDDHVRREPGTSEYICKQCCAIFIQGGKGRWYYCPSCREEQKKARDKKNASYITRTAAKLAKDTGNNLIDASVVMARRPASYDDEYARIPESTEINGLLHDIERDGFVWGKSCTVSPHREPFNTRSLDAMIDYTLETKTVPKRKPGPGRNSKDT